MRCKAWTIRSWRIVRCTYEAKHAATSKYHCSHEGVPGKGWVWLVSDKERGNW